MSRMRFTIMSAVALLALAVGVQSKARGQDDSAGLYVRPYGYPFGFYPYSYQGYWSNGYSLYGPPVPAMGPTPGAFGGSDARLNYRNGPDTVPARGFPKANYGFVTPTYARFEVTVPPDAVVSLEGLPVDQSGPQRTFRATGLEPGQSYWLRLKATWTDNGQDVVRDQAIHIRGGQTVRIDLTRGEAPAPPSK